MATPKQIAANRANSQKSTGPRTSEGKANSRYNGLKHGIFAVSQIMFDEKAEDLAELAAEYHEQYSPANPDERFLVDTLVHNEWRLRRMRRVEAELWLTASFAFVVKNIETTIKCSSGDAFATSSATFERLQRVVNSCERNYRGAAKDLECLQAARLAPEKSAEPTQLQQSKVAYASLASFRYNPLPPFSADHQPPPAPATPAETGPT